MKSVPTTMLKSLYTFDLKHKKIGIITTNYVVLQALAKAVSEAGSRIKDKNIHVLQDNGCQGLSSF